MTGAALFAAEACSGVVRANHAARAERQSERHAPIAMDLGRAPSERYVSTSPRHSRVPPRGDDGSGEAASADGVADTSSGGGTDKSTPPIDASRRNGGRVTSDIVPTPNRGDGMTGGAVDRSGDVL